MLLSSKKRAEKITCINIYYPNIDILSLKNCWTMYHTSILFKAIQILPHQLANARKSEENGLDF